MAEAKYGIILKIFLSLISLIFEKKKRDKSKFSWKDLLFKPYIIKTLPNISEQEKKWREIYYLLHDETKPPPPKKKNPEINGVSLWPPWSSDPDPIAYALWGVLENKINFPSKYWFDCYYHRIIGLTEGMSEVFILKAYKLFRRRVDTINEKKKGFWVWPSESMAKAAHRQAYQFSPEIWPAEED